MFLGLLPFLILVLSISPIHSAAYLSLDATPTAASWFLFFSLWCGQATSLRTTLAAHLESASLLSRSAPRKLGKERLLPRLAQFWSRWSSSDISMSWGLHWPGWTQSRHKACFITMFECMRRPGGWPPLSDCW